MHYELCGKSLSLHARIRRHIYSTATKKLTIFCRPDGASITFSQNLDRELKKELFTSGPRIATKFTPLSVAIARTSTVLLQPGGPHSNTPLGARTPRRASFSRCTSGHSTHSRKRAMMFSSPPTSENRTGGMAIACARSADGRTVGSAATRSAAVRCAVSADCRVGDDDEKRLMASVPASRTTAARSAPT
jgi:hypothetical protein